MKKHAISTGLAIVMGLTLSARASVILETSRNVKDGTVASLGGRSFFTIDPIGENRYSFTISMTAGQAFYGVAAFDNRSIDPLTTSGRYTSPNDVAKVLVSPIGGLATELWSMSSYQAWDLKRGSAVNSAKCPFIDWTPWSFVAPTDGAYTFEYQVLADGVKHDKKYDSRAMFAAIPEPSTWVSGALAGLVTLFGLFRKTRRIS